MNLDDLKTTWQKETQDYSRSGKKDMEQLQLILTGKTLNVMDKVKRKYNAIIVAVVIYTLGTKIIAPVLIAWNSGDWGGVITPRNVTKLAVEGLLCLLVVCFYRIKYVRSKNNVPLDDLKTALTSNIAYLKKSFKQEAYFIVGMFCFFVVIAISISLYEGKMPVDFNNKRTVVYFFMGILALLILFGLTLRFVFKRKRDYDANMANLKQYLAELE